MKYAVALAALAALGVQAQQCRPSKDLQAAAVDPLQLFDPKDAQFPCDMGAAIPLGPVPTGCAKLEVIVARGTTEPGPLGMVVGDPVVARLQRDLGKNVARGYPVQYPASILGMDQGMADIPKRLKQQAQACPDEKFALMGYSQGAMIVAAAIPNIPKELQSKIIAVALYGGGTGDNTGDYKSKTIANCAPGDFACPNSGTGPGHVSYNNVGTNWHERTAKYIEDAFNGKPQGQKLMRTPTK